MSRRLLLILLVVTLSPSITLYHVYASSTVWRWDSTVGFKLNAYGTTIDFSHDIYIDYLEWGYDNKYWNTTVLWLSFTDYGLWGISIRNGNVTFTDFLNTSDYIIKATVEASSGVWSYLTIYYPEDYPVEIHLVKDGSEKVIKYSQYYLCYECFSSYPDDAVYLNQSGRYIVLKALHGSPVYYTIYFSTSQSTSEEERITLENVRFYEGDVVTPHLYSWRFDGSKYLEVSYQSIFNSSIVSIGSGFNTSISSFPILYHRQYTLEVYNGRLVFRYYNVSNWVSYIEDNQNIYLGNIYNVSIYYNTSFIKFYVNNELVSEWSGSFQDLPSSTDSIYIGYNTSDYFNGDLDYIILCQDYNLHESGYILNLTHPILFLDPTFYNGSSYVDLYYEFPASGDVERIESSGKWIWIARNGESDQYIHFKYFPINTTLSILLRNGVMKVWTVDSLDFQVSKEYFGNYTWDIIYYIDQDRILIKPHETPSPVIPEYPSLPSFIDFYRSWWGYAVWAIPMLIPVSIYLKTKHPGLVLASIILVSLTAVLTAPTMIKGVYAVAAAASLALLIYKVMYQK